MRAQGPKEPASLAAKPLKSENNNRDHQAAPPPPPAKNQRPTYLPVPVIPVTVQCDYDSDESDGPILYRDDEDENMSEEGKNYF